MEGTLPPEVAQRKWEAREMRRTRSIARLLEERRLVEFMDEQEKAAAQKASNIQQAVEKAVAKENARLQELDRRAENKQAARDAQNAMLAKRRIGLQERRDRMFEISQLRETNKKQAEARRRYELEQERMVRTGRLVQNKQVQDEERHMRFDERQRRFQALQDKKVADAAELARHRAELADERQRKRQVTIQERQAADARRREMLAVGLKRRADVGSELREARAHAARLRLIEAKQARLEKVANVERSRRRAAFKAEQTRCKLEQGDTEYKQKKQLEGALDRLRTARRRERLITQHKRDQEDELSERQLSPGPGQYHVASTLKGGFGFSSSKLKNVFEQEAARAQALPGPGDSQNVEFKGPSGGGFSTAKPKSDIEVKMALAAQMPAPGEAQNVKYRPKAGGSFSNAKVKSDIEVMMDRAAALPGPSAYAVEGSFKARPMKLSQVQALFKTKVLKKTAMDIAAEGFAGGNKTMLSSLRKNRFKMLGRRLSASFDDHLGQANGEGGVEDEGAV
eukprot:g2918.t1